MRQILLPFVPGPVGLRLLEVEPALASASCRPSARASCSHGMLGVSSMISSSSFGAGACRRRRRRRPRSGGSRRSKYDGVRAAGDVDDRRVRAAGDLLDLLPACAARRGGAGRRRRRRARRRRVLIRSWTHLPVALVRADAQRELVVVVEVPEPVLQPQPAVGLDRPPVDAVVQLRPGAAAAGRTARGSPGPRRTLRASAFSHRRPVGVRLRARGTRARALGPLRLARRRRAPRRTCRPPVRGVSPLPGPAAILRVRSSAKNCSLES